MLSHLIVAFLASIVPLLIVIWVNRNCYTGPTVILAAVHIVAILIITVLGSYINA